MQRHIPLNVHTCASAKETVMTASDVLAFAAQDGAPAVAITDLNSVSSLYEVADAVSQKEGALPRVICGTRLHVKGKKKAEEITLLAKNKAALQNLFAVLSSGYTEKPIDKRWPCAEQAFLSSHRAGLLVGKECPWALIRRAEKKNAAAVEREIETRFAGCDYVEMRPWSQNGVPDTPWDAEENEGLVYAARLAVRLLKKRGIPVVAATGANVASKGQGEVVAALKKAKKALKSRDTFPLLSSEKMLSEYAYLGEYAEEAVLQNPAAIAEKCEPFSLVECGGAPFSLPGAEEKVRSLAEQALFEKYAGEPITAARLARELADARTQGSLSLFLLLTDVAAALKSEGEGVSLGGTGANAFLSYLLGLTTVNPLPPHTLCPRCKKVTWLDEKHYPHGADYSYENKGAVCLSCATPLLCDGANLSPTLFFGAHGEKVPHLQLRLSAGGEETADRYLLSRFGKSRVFRDEKEDVGRYDRNAGILAGVFFEEGGGHACLRLKQRRGGNVFLLPEGASPFAYTPLQYESPEEANRRMPFSFYAEYRPPVCRFSIWVDGGKTNLNAMARASGVLPENVPIYDVDFAAAVRRLPFETAKISADTVDRMQKTYTQKNRFSSFVKICGFAHGTRTWENNAKTVLENGGSEEETVATRDDVMNALCQAGMPEEEAYALTERARRGEFAHAKKEQVAFIEAAQKDGRLPPHYAESLEKVRYLPPRAVCIEYVRGALCAFWYQTHSPRQNAE